MIGWSLVLLATLLLALFVYGLVAVMVRGVAGPRICGRHSCTCAWGVGLRKCSACGCPTPVRGSPGTL